MQMIECENLKNHFAIAYHLQDAKVRKIPSNQNFANLQTGGGTKPLVDIEKRKKGKCKSFFKTETITITLCDSTVKTCTLALRQFDDALLLLSR